VTSDAAFIAAMAVRDPAAAGGNRSGRKRVSCLKKSSRPSLSPPLPCRGFRHRLLRVIADARAQVDGDLRPGSIGAGHGLERLIPKRVPNALSRLHIPFPSGSEATSGAGAGGNREAESPLRRRAQADFRRGLRVPKDQNRVGSIPGGC